MSTTTMAATIVLTDGSPPRGRAAHVNGAYGRREVCGMPIPAARLAAMPTARRHVECQEWLEREPEHPLRLGC